MTLGMVGLTVLVVMGGGVFVIALAFAFLELVLWAIDRK